jgi:glycosyltransferase involved in cell wall biosynthesis
MPVYNGGSMLAPAIESVLAQTFTDFEFIIINDGSTDDTESTIRGFNDPRIQILDQPNRGIVASLNRGLQVAKGTYIARMDADDLSRPERLARQVAYLDAHPEVAVVGTAFAYLDESGREIGFEAVLLRNIDIQRHLFLGNPFGHSSIMARRDAIRETEGYRDSWWPAEDYDLWRRIARSHELANLPEPLYAYRASAGGISAAQSGPQLQLTNRLIGEIWRSLPLPHMDGKAMRAGAAYYKRLGDRRFLEAYLRDQTMIIAALAVRRRFSLAWREWLALLVVSPGGAIHLAAGLVVQRLRR